MTHDTHHDLDDLGGGRFRSTIYLKPVRYRSAGGVLLPIVNDWMDGDASRPHMVTAAPFLVSVGGDGLRRIHPTRELDRYFEFGAPYIKPAGVWRKVNLGAPVRADNRLTWTTANAIMSLVMAGHYVKLGIELKSGWQPPNGQFAFPVGLNGLTRSGNGLLADGRPVMTMRAPHVEDLDNPFDMRPIASQFVNVGGQDYVLFTLPSLAGMARPFIDPTLTLQPGAADGIDTTLESSNPDANIGTLNIMAVGERNDQVNVDRALIKFDLSTVPANAILSSTVLSLYALTDYSSNARTFRVYRQKRAWVINQTTWNIYSTGNNWQTAGGFGADDCEQTDIGSRNFTATETLNEFKDFALTPTSKSALDLGNGWLIKADTETDDNYHLATSDHATAANRPKLVVEYTLATNNVYVKIPKYRISRRDRWRRI